MAKVKVGVIGLGFGSQVQVPCFQEHPDTEVVAVCASRLARAQEVARQHGVPHAFDDYREVVRLPDLDVVSVAAPPYLHHPMALAALAAGKHVLCEKPFALSVKEAREMVAAAREAGRVAMVNHEFRHLPARAYAHELVRQGYLGTLLTVHMSLFMGGPGDPAARPFGWLYQEERGGGFLGALGSHFIDAVRFLTGDEFAGVVGRLETVVQQRKDPATGELRAVTADDTFTCAFRLRGGTPGALVGCYNVRFGPGSRIELYGTQGTLVMATRVLNHEPVLLGGRAGDEGLQELPIPPRLVPFEEGDDVRDLPFKALVTRLAAAVRGEAEPSPTFEDGLRCQEVMDALRLSHREGRWVPLPLDGDT